MGKTTILVNELLSWQGVLDILLIAAGLFFLYRTIMRLGTWKILAGILMAFLVFVLASALNLKGIEWIYQNVSHVAVIGLIVIFQPELRKILEKAVSVSPHRAKDLDRKLPALITECLGKLAKEQCGALIVFPGKEPLGDKISGGYALNALPSVPLILSIFDPNSPGHDGAVLIDGNRLTLFGVRLPMSQTTRLSEEYGTRHHAAMGLAEQTDALALVVSEERGAVSSFSNGEMKPLDSAEAIIGEILAHQRNMGFLGGDGSARISRQTLLQLTASLVIALIFWSTLIVAQREVVERILTTAIEYTPPGENLAMIGEKTDTVKLFVAGPKSEVEQLAQDPPSVTIDLSRMAKGSQTIIITNENLRLPEGVILQGTTPQQLKVTLAAMVEKTVPIKPQIIGKLPGTLKIKKITVTPENVLITAPVDKSDSSPEDVITTPIYLDSIATDTTLFCKVIPRPSMQPAGKKWPDVEVSIEVKN